MLYQHINLRITTGGGGVKLPPRPVFSTLLRNRWGCRDVLSRLFLDMAGLQNEMKKFPKYLLRFFQYGGRNLEVHLENLQKRASLVISLVALYICVEFQCLSYVFMVTGIDDTVGHIRNCPE